MLRQLGSSGGGGASGPGVVQSVVYSGSLSTARPSGANAVVWVGFPSAPTNVGANDVWLDTAAGAALLTGTAAPTSGVGADGDVYIRTGASAAVYGPKASGAWPSGTSLVGRGVTSIARTSGTGAAGTTDTYTITYSDATTSTFSVVNGADGASGGTTTYARHATIRATVMPTAYSAAPTFSYQSSQATITVGVAVNNYMEWEVGPVDAGTYTLRVVYSWNTNQGIGTVSIDGVDQVTTIDMYGTAAINKDATFTGIALTAGRHLIRFRALTKNVSSSNYALLLQEFTLTRTGA